MRTSAIITSPVGDLLAIADGSAITHLLFADGEHARAMSDVPVEHAEDFAGLRDQLAEYFAGERQTFDLTTTPDGTPFQRRVWSELERIPYGETISYGELARRIDNPKAVRAVGGANNKNPISIVVPCHRVIGAGASLVGYGGGLARKKTLLALEGAAVSAQLELGV